MTSPPAASAERPSPSGELDVAAVQRVWQPLLDAVRVQSRATQALLSNATVTAVERDTLVLTLPTAPLAQRLADQRSTELIKEALRTVLGVQWQVRCEHAGGGPAPRGTARPPQPQRTRSPERPARASDPAAGRTAPPVPRRSAAPDDSIPLPPEPPDSPEPPDFAEPPKPPEPELEDSDWVPARVASRPSATAEKTMTADAEMKRADSRHPDEVALELLTDQLGARPINGR